MNANQIIDTLGGTAAVARMFKIKQPSVSEWRKTGIPSARLQFLEVVRPDIFGAPPQATGRRCPMRREGFLDLSDSSLEPSLGGSNLLIVRVPFAGPPSVPTFFWTEISGPENRKLAFIKFERRLFIRSESLFVATEWRPADSGDLPPEPFLRFSGYQKQGCAGSRTDTLTPMVGTGVLCTCGCKPTKRNAPCLWTNSASRNMRPKPNCCG